MANACVSLIWIYLPILFHNSKTCFMTYILSKWCFFWFYLYKKCLCELIIKQLSLSKYFGNQTSVLYNIYIFNIPVFSRRKCFHSVSFYAQWLFMDHKSHETYYLKQRSNSIFLWPRRLLRHTWNVIRISDCGSAQMNWIFKCCQGSP